MRLGEEGDLEETYKSIGNFLKHKCSGYRGYVFTANTLLAGKIGLKSGRKIPFQSGKIDCRLYEYSLYAGSRT
jgi:putative N6-adenine-specific DNA methylase